MHPRSSGPTRVHPCTIFKAGNVKIHPPTPILIILVMLLAAGCAPTNGVPATATQAPVHALPVVQVAQGTPALQAPSPTPSPTLLSPTATPTAEPPIPSAAATAVATTNFSPTSTPTPYPLTPFTLDFLRSRSYPGGDIRALAVQAENAAFTRSYIKYPSDGLQITGVMHMPTGPGPFPVIVLLHGYYDRNFYWSGAGTDQAAEFFARNGFLAVAPDLRSWGESDSDLSVFHTGLVIDVLNLFSALETIPQADLTRLMLWGHSMGGGIATKVLTVDSRVRTAVLYAPNSADDGDLLARWGHGCLPGESEIAGNKCNPAEILPPDTPRDIIESYLAAAADPALQRAFAPIYHLEHIVAPVQIHVGLADGQGLAETPPSWSEKLHLALLAAGKESTRFTYPDQGHFLQGESWLLMMQRSLAFFQAIK